MTIVKYPVPRPMRTLALLLCLLSTPLWAQKGEAPSLLYRSGLSYQISSDPSWGKGCPVVTGSRPYSPAYTADLRVGDIIRQIDGVSTQGLSLEDIQSLLERPVRTHLLTINSPGRELRQVALTPEAKELGAVSERELARAFALYSLEDEQVRRLSYPFVYRSSVSYDLSSVRTYSFAPSTEESRELDAELYAQISELLERTGLRRDDTSPDLILECFYELRPETSTLRDASIPKATSHYDLRARDFARLPILPYTSGVTGSYSVHLALHATRPQHQDSILWSCESRDMLSEAMTLKDYARYMLPMMLLLWIECMMWRIIPQPSGQVCVVVIRSFRSMVVGSLLLRLKSFLNSTAPLSPRLIAIGIRSWIPSRMPEGCRDLAHGTNPSIARYARSSLRRSM